MANDPLRRGSRDPGQGESMHGQQGESMHGASTEHPHGSTAQGTATISRGAPVREEPPHRPPEPPRRPRINPFIPLGILGLLLLGGLIAGLVASHNPVRHVTRHVPAPPRAASTLSVFARHGSGSSAPFTVPSSPVKANYGYSCPAGTTGHFIARLANASGSDTQTIVNSPARTGSSIVTLHPKHPGSGYHTTVTAPSASCGYRIAITR